MSPTAAMNVVAVIRDVPSNAIDLRTREVTANFFFWQGLRWVPLGAALLLVTWSSLPAFPLPAPWREALACVLGEEATDLEDLARRKRRAMGGQHAPMGLGDLFFDPDDPLHPDADDEDEDDDD